MDENKEMITEPEAEKDNRLIPQAPASEENASAEISAAENNDSPAAEENGGENSDENNDTDTPAVSETAPAAAAESAATTAAQVPVISAIPVAPAQSPRTEKVMWSYARQVEEDKKKALKKGRRGALIYSIIMTSLFVVCFAALAVLLAVGGVEGTDSPSSSSSSFPSRAEGMSIAALVENVEKSVITVSVKLDNGSAIGSGFVYNDYGYILTNYHVIDDAVSISVIDYSGKDYSAEFIDGDEIADVAVLYVKNLPLPKVKLGDSAKVMLGEEVVAIGTPLDIEYAGTVTNGIISGIDRVVSLYDDAGYLSKTMTLIQTNTTLNPGNSGGPLFNMDGEVIGINTLKHASSQDSEINYEGIGFAIRINDAIEIADDIIEDGEYSGNKGSASEGVKLGIKCGDVYKGERTEISQGVFVTPEADGVLVISVDEGYPAYGKLQELDIVVSFNGIRTTTVDTMTAELYKCKIGDKVTLEVWRNGQLIKVEITL